MDNRKVKNKSKSGSGSSGIKMDDFVIELKSLRVPANMRLVTNADEIDRGQLEAAEPKPGPSGKRDSKKAPTMMSALKSKAKAKQHKRQDGQSTSARNNDKATIKKESAATHSEKSTNNHQKMKTKTKTKKIQFNEKSGATATGGESSRSKQVKVERSEPMLYRVKLRKFD